MSSTASGADSILSDVTTVAFTPCARDSSLASGGETVRAARHEDDVRARGRQEPGKRFADSAEAPVTSAVSGMG